MAWRKPKYPIPGIGPACTPELLAAGIDSVERIRELGWREAYLRWVDAYPSRINVNAALNILAAEKGVPWFAIQGADKEEVQNFVKSLRAKRGRYQ